jgi:hypothetical protein
VKENPADLREQLARAIDREAFEEHPIELRSEAAAIQWGARRRMARDAAANVLLWIDRDQVESRRRILYGALVALARSEQGKAEPS